MRTLATDRPRGLLFAMASNVCLAAVILLSGASLRVLDPWTHSAYVFVSGSLCFLAWFALSGDYAAFRPKTKLFLGRMAVVSLIDALSFVLYMTGVQSLPPTAAALYQQSWYLMAVLVGVVFLRERFSKMGVFGLAVGLGGAVWMVDASAAPLSLGAGYILAAGMVMSAGIALARLWTQDHPPLHVAFFRAVGIAAVLVLVTASKGTLFTPRPIDLAFAAATGFVGPFLNITALFVSLRYLEAGRVAMTRPVAALLVIVFSVVFFDEIPTTRQFLGGALLVTGLILVNVRAGRASRSIPPNVAPLDYSRERNEQPT